MKKQSGHRVKVSHSAFDANLWPMHAMIVSRSASHIASTLSAPQRMAALSESVEEVTQEYGPDAVAPFLLAIGTWLAQREYHEAVQLVNHMQLHGSLPEIADAKPSRSRSRASACKESSSRAYC